MALEFGKVPTAAKVPPAPFKVNISDEQIEELQTLVKLSKLAPPTYEGVQKDRKYGITTEWLATAKETWKRFDWRTIEARINGFPQFTYDIEDTTIHFVSLFSQRKDAVPVLFVHGWPGSFFEFLPLLSIFRDEYTPETLPFHLIVPSLPGYTFSSGPPVDKDFGTQDVARILNHVMVNLGFESGYVVQGGDIGAKIARILAVDYDACKAVHLNACFMTKPSHVSNSSLSETEIRGLDRAKWFGSSGSGYLLEQSTRTSTVGNVLSTNPVALLAWIGEKFLDWVDEPLPLETILESVTLYWLTETASRSMYHYREGFPPPKVMPAMDPRWHISKPLGFSYFPVELVPVPRSWIETTGNLVFWKEHEKGGHFAALERPRDLAEDITAFIEKAWKLE